MLNRIITPKYKGKIKDWGKLHSFTQTVDAASYPVFEPNPGGQREIFDRLSLSSIYGGAYRWYWILGGINSGKSTCAAAFICNQARLDPSIRILITANSYPQLMMSTLVALAEFCEKFGYKLEPSFPSPEDTAAKIAALKHCKIEGAYCFVRSADSFTGATEKAKQGGRGIQVRIVWWDEGSYNDRMCFQTIDGRLGRGAGSVKGIGIISSSINRINPFNWTYDLFASDRRDELQKQIYGSTIIPTTENIHADPDFVRSQEASLTPELRALELEGRFVSITTGRVFNYFKRDRHLKSISVNLNLYLCVSFDFNRSPATCLVAQSSGRSVEVVREFYLLESDTMQLAEAVAQYLRKLGVSVLVYGDSTGIQRTANSKFTNWQIVWDTFSRHGVYGVRKYPDRNASVLDSVHSVNNAFNRDEIFIDPSCKELIADLEFLTWDKNDKIDKRDIKRSHLGDCLRYLIDGILPYRRETIKRSGRWG